MHRIPPFVLVFTLMATLAGAQSAPPTLAPPPGLEVDGDAAYYFLAARHLENTGKIDEAVAALRKAISLEPGSAELRAELASLYARQNNAVDALNAADEGLKLNPDNREANRTLGSIYAALAEQKRPIRPGDDPSTYGARAIAALERAQATSRVDLGVELTLGRLYARQGQHERAIAALERVFEAQPEYSEGGMMLAASQEAAGHLQDATKTIEAIVGNDPTFLRAYPKLIDLFEQQRRWKEAAAAYALARKANPRADLAGGHAAALLNSGEPRQAQAVLHAAIGSAPAPDAGLLYLLAEAHRQLKDYEAAAATVEKLLASFPGDLRGHVMAAQLHVSQGRTAEAISAYADLVKRAPGEASFAYQYAQLLESAGRVNEAEAALRDVLARNPQDANALNSLGYLFADRGERLDEAVDLLQRALKIDPGNPSYLDSLGWAFFKQGRLDQADGPLTEAAAKSPGNSVILDHLGDLRFKQQRLADAVRAWESALAGDGENIERAAVEKKLRDARARTPRVTPAR
jgi:tetratricopeptide (TPR) repeat protein